MNKKHRLITVVAAVLLASILLYLFAFKDKSASSVELAHEPAHSMDTHEDEQAGEHADEEEGHEEEGHAEEEGMLHLTAKQIKTAGIQIASVSMSSVGELTVPGTVVSAPNGVARLDARADGVVTKITKRLGDFVDKGEIVAFIESTQAADLSSSIASAEARLNQAEATYAREKQLFTAQVTAKQDLEAARAEFSLAQSELNRAQASAKAAGLSGSGSGSGSSVAVSSPIAGRVTSSSALLGAYVTAGTELYRVVDPTRIQIEAALPSGEASRIKSGDLASIQISDQPVIQAQVRSVTPALNPQSRTATAVLVPFDKNALILPDSFVQVSIQTSDSPDKTTLRIPQNALQTIDGADAVFVRTSEGFMLTKVQTGTRSGGQVVVEQGLKAGQAIATQNAFLLKAELGKGEAEHGH